MVAIGAMESADFNLTGGGILRRVLPQRWLGSATLRAAIVVLAWLPVLVLCIVAGTAVGDNVETPFLGDPVPHARFLLAFPIFIASGSLIRRQWHNIASYLWGCSVLVGEDRNRYQAAVGDVGRRFDSTAVDVLSVIAAFALSAILAHGQLHDGVSTWFATDSGVGEQLTAAGWWYTVVSLPLWLSLFLRWGFRVVFWWIFLWRVSRLDLQLLPTHPDRAGGLGILETGQTSLAILVFGSATVLSASLADAVFHSRETLTSVAPMIALHGLSSLVVIVSPLLAFSARLVRTKYRGLAEYGDLADDLFQEFNDKWLHRDDEGRRKLLGNTDPSSLADYGYAYEVVTEMRTLPFSRNGAVIVLVLALVPFVPLLFLQYSLKDAARWLLGILG
jgi:hypothetical protein